MGVTYTAKAPSNTNMSHGCTSHGTCYEPTNDLWACTVQVLAAAEPAAALAAFREPLQAALAGPQDADRPRTYAAAEVLAGLLASGALFAADAGAFPSWPAQ